MTTHNDTPNTCLSHSQPKPLTTNGSSISIPTNIRHNHMISLLLYTPPCCRTTSKHNNNVSMMTRHRTRRYVSRPPHLSCTKRTSIWYDPFHYFRSILLRWLLLSILSLQLSPNPSNGRTLTPYRHFPT